MSNPEDTQEGENTKDEFADNRYAVQIGTQVTSNNLRRSRTPANQGMPARVIRKPEDLSAWEKDALKDIVREWMKSRPLPNPDKTVIPGDLWESFLRRIFDMWSSINERNHPPKIGQRVAADVNVQVGVLHQNHPPAGGKRKSDGELVSLPPSKNRKSGDPVFMGPTLQYGQQHVRWMFRDAGGKLVNWEHIRFDDDYDEIQAITTCMRLYDDAERRRVVTHNNALAVSLARRRIVRFARHGLESRTDPRVLPEDVAVGFVQLELIQDVVFRESQRVQAMVKEAEDNGFSEATWWF